MKSRVRWALTLGGVVGLAAITCVVGVSAQNPPKYTPHTLAQATFEDNLRIFGQMLPDEDGGLWLAQLRTQGATDMYVQDNVWDPGGAETSWHYHSGPSIVIVKAGTVTAYGPDCIPHDYTAGDPNNKVFIDGNDVHMLKNNSKDVVAETIAVQFVRKGAPRKVDLKLDQIPCPGL
jgi:quercetin dioxygenase-like cupin family protein